MSLPRTAITLLAFTLFLTLPAELRAACTAPPGYTKAWQGTNGTGWSVANNWSPAGAPAAADSVYICASTPAQPALTAGASVANLRIDTGASLSMGAFNLNVSGSLESASITATSGLLSMTGTSRTLKGQVANLRINSGASVTLTGATTATGNVTVNSTFNIGGQTLTVNGNLTNDMLGDRLTMTNAADRVIVNGDVTFAGGGANGILIAGELQIGGNFTENNECCTGNAFKPSGSHRTVFIGGKAQTVSFLTGGTNGFHDVEIRNTGTLVQTSTRPNVLVKGDMIDSIGGRWQAANTTFTASGLSLPPVVKTNATFSANTTLETNSTIDGNMTVTGTFRMNGHTLRVTGNFTTNTLGDSFTMTDASDQLIVDGNVTFGGGGGLNLLTAGVIRIKGNFTETNECCTNEAFRPSGTHTTIFEGTNSTINFTTGGNNAFHHLRIAGGVTLTTNVRANGQLIAPSAAVARVVTSSNGRTLTAAGLDVSDLVFDNVLLRSNGGTLARLDDSTFRNFDPTATQLAVTHPGGTVTFRNNIFSTTPTTGKYVSATDSASTDGNRLTVVMSNSTPADGSAFESENGGAVINWIVNRAPSASPDAYSLDEDQVLTVSAASGVLKNDSDPDGDALTATLVSPPTSGSLTLRGDGSFDYTPRKDFFGVATFTYTAADSQGGKSAATTVALTIRGANDAPLAANDAYGATSNGRLSVIAPGVLRNDRDPDGDRMTALLVTHPSNGTVALQSSGAFVYTPARDFSGTDTFTYYAADASSKSAPATVTISVAPGKPSAGLLAVPPTISKGDTATLLWRTTGASTIRIEPQVGAVNASGSTVVTPATTTTYTLTAASGTDVVTAQATVTVVDPPAVTVVSRPRPLTQRPGIGGDTSQFVIANFGGSPASVTLARTGDFFTETPGSFTLAPRKHQIVTLTGSGRAAGHYVGSISVTGDGLSAPLNVPVHLISSDATAGRSAGRATTHRVDVTSMSSGSVTFENSGTAELRGMVWSDVAWIIPRQDSVTIPAGGSVTVTFDIDRSRRGTTSGSTSTGSVHLTHFSGVSGSSTDATATDDTGSTSSTVSVVVKDVAAPVSTATSIPPLSPTQVVLYLPGVMRTPTIVSDFALVNRSPSITLSDVAIYFTSSGSAPFNSQAATLTQFGAGLSRTFADAIKNIFGNASTTGAMQVRGDTANLAVSAKMSSISNRAGTYGTSLRAIPSDRAARQGESLYLTGVSKATQTRTDLFLQETAGNPASARLEYFDRNGTALSQETRNLDGFAITEIRDAAPAGAVVIRVTNLSGSNGNIVARAILTDEQVDDLTDIVDWNLTAGLTELDSQLVPFVMSGPLATGAQTTTTVVISNRGGEAASAVLRFERGGSRKRLVRPTSSSGKVSADSTSDATITLAANETLVLSDVLRNSFGVTGSATGYLTLTPLSGSVTMTTLLESSGGVTQRATTAIPTVSPSSALETGASLSFAGIEDASPKAIDARRAGTFRTLLGLVETTGKPATVRVTMEYHYIPAQSLVAARATATRDFNVTAGGITLVDNVAKALLGDIRDSLGDLHDVTIDVSNVAGEGSVLPFVQEVDNGSGDMIFRLE